MLIDALVIVIYFVAVVQVGLKFGQKENSLESFALGGRQIPWWAVLASIIAAETSAATFLGTPGEGFKLVNYSMIQLLIGTVIGRTIVAFLFIKPFYDNKVFSIYEYLEVRFGKLTREIASAIFLVTRLLASGARLYVAAIVLAVGYTIYCGHVPSADTQLWIYAGSIVLLTIVTAIYTSVGGIKAVVWTDCIQSSVMIGGAIASIVLLLQLIGGTSTGSQVLADLYKSGTVLVPNFGIKGGDSPAAAFLRIMQTDYTIWAGILGMSFTALATHGTDQDMVQRMLTAPDYKKSRLSLVLSGLADVPIAFIFLTIGILLNVYFQTHPDPLAPKSTNEIFAYFMLRSMPVGLRGLLIAGIFATSMGSLSAALNALATSFTRDWYQKRAQDDSNSVAVVRKSTYVFAVLMILVACSTAYFVIKNPDSRIIPIVLGIFGYTYGSLLGIFLVGLLTKNRGSDRGNALAMAVGFVAVAAFTGLPNQLIVACGGQPLTFFQQLPVVAFPWRIMLGAIVTFTTASLFKTKLRDSLEPV